MSKITVIVTGETGSGKSAIAGEIEIALKAIGVPVVWQAADRENWTHGNEYWIDLYKPEVTITELNIPMKAERRPHKVMTPEEYAATPLQGWHEVCRDVDGFGGVGVRYLGVSQDASLSRS